MRLWLIHHGETQANIDGLYSGHAPTPLTARGIEQAQNLHTLLHGVSFDLVLCSELERAQHTARRVLSDRQLPVQIIPELNEMFFGDWEMRHHRDLMQEDAENYSALTRGVGAPLISTKNSRRYASSIAVPSGSRMHDFSVFLRVSRNDH